MSDEEEIARDTSSPALMIQRSFCMAMTLYHVNWCPDCAVVRERLEELHLAYDDVIVPDVRPLRKQVYEVSGQYYVPVLKDGDLVLTETHDILDHLNRTYRKKQVGDGA